MQAHFLSATIDATDWIWNFHPTLPPTNPNHISYKIHPQYSTMSKSKVSKLNLLTVSCFSMSRPCIVVKPKSIPIKQKRTFAMATPLIEREPRPRRFAPLKKDTGDKDLGGAVRRLKGVIFDVDGTLWYVFLILGESLLSNIMLLVGGCLNGSWGWLLRHERESGLHPSGNQNQDMIGRATTPIWSIRCPSSVAS
jgi:hypothetical protein